jgi:hypothetical protein
MRPKAFKIGHDQNHALKVLSTYDRQGIDYILGGIGCLSFWQDAFTWHSAAYERITKPCGFRDRRPWNQDTATNDQRADNPLMKELCSRADTGLGFPVLAGSKDQRYIGGRRWEPPPVKQVPEAN